MNEEEKNREEKRRRKGGKEKERETLRCTDDGRQQLVFSNR